MATRSSSGNRSHGKFATRCGCLNHEFFNESSSPRLYLTKNVSRRLSYKVLIERNLLTRRNKHVCKDCLAYAQKHFVRSYSLESSFSELNVTNSDNSAPDTSSLSETCPDIVDVDDSVLQDHSCDSLDLSETDKLEDDLENIIDILKSINSWSKLNENCRQKVCEIAKILGLIINTDIFENTKSANNEYKNIDIDKHHWIKGCNKLLVQFLQSATGCKDISDNEKKTNAFTHLLEQVHYARNLKYVSPFAFQRNVVSYSLTNSKICTNLTGHWESSGCYSTVHDFICSPADPISCPEGYVHCAIDNNQKIGKSSGRISEGSKVPMDICTSVSNFLVNPNSSIQNSESLAPSAWQDISEDAFSSIVLKVNEYEKGYQDVFRNYRNQYISEIITEVKNDQSKSIENEYQDHVDTSLRQYDMGANNHVCMQCNYVYSSLRQSRCPQCKRDPRYNPLGYDPYFRTPSKHVDPPVVSVGEPCMVNPNNEERLKQVLCQLRDICITPSERSWLVVWSDGIPYLYSMRLQQNIYICASCNEYVDVRKESLTDHASKPNHDPQNFNVFSRAFGDFIFRPGPGHIELNMARCLLNFCWPVLLPVVGSLGFRTKKAQDVVKRGADHHRSKQILFTLFKALAHELIVPYVRLSLQQGGVMSVESFYGWVNDSVVDPNYLYLFDMCFTFLLAFKMYNEGVRKNHHEVMMASRIFFAPLFFAGTHPKYQELHVRDLCDRVQYPDDLTIEMNKTESFSVSGENNRGQGADFVHEEKNKFIKSFLPPGVPNTEIWQRVSRKSETLKQLKEQCCIELSQPCKSRTSRFDIEQLMMQRHLRPYLSSPYLRKPHKSLNGEPLDNLLHSIKSVGRRNYAAYKQNLSKVGKFGGVKLESVFISAESRTEHEKIENKTKAEIIAEIRNIITVMPNESIQDSYRSQVSNLKATVKKSGLIELYYEVSLELEDQLAGEIIPDASDELE